MPSTKNSRDMVIYVKQYVCIQQRMHQNHIANIAKKSECNAKESYSQDNPTESVKPILNQNHDVFVKQIESIFYI